MIDSSDVSVINAAAGLRGCIGYGSLTHGAPSIGQSLILYFRWRFSLIEMQAIIVALIENFEFSLPPKEQRVEIVRKPIGLMSPMVKDRYDEGVLMPLAVKAI